MLACQRHRGSLSRPACKAAGRGGHHLHQSNPPPAKSYTYIALGILRVPDIQRQKPPGSPRKGSPALPARRNLGRRRICMRMHQCASLNLGVQTFACCIRGFNAGAARSMQFRKACAWHGMHSYPMHPAETAATAITGPAGGLCESECPVRHRRGIREMRGCR
jgi:hypothetical protein